MENDQTTNHPLKAWRMRQRPPLSQTELARRLDVTPQVISMIESYKRGCSLDVALRIRNLAGQKFPLEHLTGRRPL